MKKIETTELVIFDGSYSPGAPQIERLFDPRNFKATSKENRKRRLRRNGAVHNSKHSEVGPAFSGEQSGKLIGEHPHAGTLLMLLGSSALPSKSISPRSTRPIAGGRHNNRNFSTLKTQNANTRQIPVALLRLGRIVTTPHALETLAQEEILTAIQRHQAGDWGEVSEDDRAENDRSLKEDLRLLSVYHAKDGTKFWVVTEADRSVTTVLMPEDY